MGSLFDPAQDNAQRSATALNEAADALAAARDPAAFLAALETNHRVWLRLHRLAGQHGWTVPERRHTEFALATSGRGGRAVTDAQVEALIRVDREAALAIEEAAPRHALAIEEAAPWRGCAALFATFPGPGTR